MSVTILQGDSVEQLKTLPGGSVDIVVTSPPYDRLRTYGGHAWDFEGTAMELFRVLCDGGVLCWNIGDSVIDGSETLTSCKQKIFFREQCGFRIHDTMIWHKANFSSPSSNRYHQVMEYVFVLSKNGPPRVWNPLKDKPNAWVGTQTFGKNTIRSSDGSRLEERKRNVITEFGMRGNVWYGPTRGQEECCNHLSHPAMMPRWIARDLILSWTNPGDTVLDPFGGSGTTAEAAVELARHAVTIELNPDYIKLIEQSTNVTPGLAI